MQPKKIANIEKASLDRRSFLRLCAATAGGAVLAACQQTLESIETPISPTSTTSPVTAVKLSLTGGDHDAWTWVKSVQVGVSDPAACEAVVVAANGREFEAKPEEDHFIAEVQLSEGENQVSAICKQTGGEVESAPVVYIGRLRQVPTAIIQVAIEDGQIILDGSGSMPAQGTEATLVHHLWTARSSNPASLRLKGGELTGEVNGELLSVLPPTVDGEYYVSLRVVDEEGREDTGTIYFVVEGGQPRIPDYDTEHPAWVDTAVVYGIVPFLFGSPAFQAIGNRLDDLADLGVNAIWLAPVNVHPADDYGYHVEDYFELDPAYGTKEDFRDLIQASHQRGIRVLMDFVPNHTADTHPYFLDAERRGSDSPYWDFYDRDASSNPTHALPQWDDLPNLNFDNPEVRRMTIEAFSYWVREFDVDGFRVDAAWAIKERRPDFWLEWRRALKRIKPDLMLLAEATARDAYYFENGFDVGYDWTARPGGWAWEPVWNAYKYRLLAYNMTSVLTNRPDGYPQDAVVFRFINNNDTGRRFITRHGEGVTRVATAMLLTLPGIPLIYTGDEYGLEFEPYQQLEPLEFEEAFPGLRDDHRRLIELRKEITSLHSRQWAPITPDAVPQAVFSYIRYGEESDRPVIVLLNFSEEPAELEFDVPAEFGDLPVDGILYDLLAGESLSALEDGRVRVSVPAQTARILAAQPLP